jgi:hypothetical protein
MNGLKKINNYFMIIHILYTGVITFIIMILLHHLYNYLQSNLTIPKVNEVIAHKEPKEIKHKEPNKDKDSNKDELKEYLNKFKKR